jgi:hypothetical protein
VWRWTVGSGVALVVLAAVHMVAQHFILDEVGGLRAYQRVLDYLANPIIFIVVRLPVRGDDPRASGTGTARVSRCAGGPARLAAIHERLQVLEVLFLDGGYSRSSFSTATNSPSLSSNVPGQIRPDPAQDAVLLDALYGRLAVVDRVAAPLCSSP